MRYAMIACEVFTREVCFLTTQSEHIITPHFLPQGMHDTPTLLNERLKAEIAKVQEPAGQHKRQIDAILLGFGLCSNALIGLEAETVPIVAPRTDDCIGIFLGSQKRYLDYFGSHEGIYWYNPGWIETAFTPSEENYKKLHETYVALYGEENAEFLMKETNNWHDAYHFAVYIQSNITDNEKYRAYTKQAAQYMCWDFDEVDGSLNLLKRLMEGNWDEESFLVCPPGFTITQSFDDSKIKAVKR